MPTDNFKIFVFCLLISFSYSCGEMPSTGESNSNVAIPVPSYSVVDTGDSVNRNRLVINLADDMTIKDSTLNISGVEYNTLAGLNAYFYKAVFGNTMDDCFEEHSRANLYELYSIALTASPHYYIGDKRYTVTNLEGFNPVAARNCLLLLSTYDLSNFASRVDNVCDEYTLQFEEGRARFYEKKAATTFINKYAE